MQKVMQGLQRVCVLFLTVLICLWISGDPLIRSSFASHIQLKTFKTHSRLSIPVDSSVEVEWKDLSQGFELLLKEVELQDLGLNAFQPTDLHDARVRSIQVSEEPQGVVIRGVWNFQQGQSSFAQKKMEHFYYRETVPATLLIDVWPQAGPTVSEVEAKAIQKNKEKALKKAQAAVQKRKEIREQEAKILAIQDDVARFCKEPFKNDVDLSLPFYPTHEPFDFNAYFPSNYPDQEYQYLLPSEQQPEAKYVRLALSLHEKGNEALAIKTIDLFDREMKGSSFHLDMKFLRANALLRLGHTSSAFALLEEIRNSNVGSSASFNAAIYISQFYLKEGNYLKALDILLWLGQNYPQHKYNWVFRMAAAESLYRLNQMDRADQEYSWVLENSPSHEGKAQAALRLGDVYLMRFQYDRALAAYYRAGEKFKDEVEKSPYVQINRAEALYGLGQYSRAKEAFEEFFKKNRSHPTGWRATLRLAEIEGRKEGAQFLSQSRDYFLKTINYYPMSPGATLARLRLIPCGDHGGFTLETANRFFEGEAQTFTGQGEIVMTHYPELKAILRVRSLILFGDLSLALQAAVQEEVGLDPQSGVSQWIAQMKRQLFRKSIVELLDSDKKFDAVNFYTRNRDKVSFDDSEWDSEEALIADPAYLLRLSRAASDLGLSSIALKMNEDYALASAQNKMARGVASQKITELELDKRIKDSEKFFTEAKALWVSDHKKNSKPIRELLKKVVDESTFSFPKEIMLGLLEEGENKIRSALQHASQAQLLASRGEPDYKADIAVIDQWISDLQVQLDQIPLAIQILNKLSENSIKGEPGITVDLGLKDLRGKAEWMISEADLLVKLGRWGEAARVYEKVVNDGLGGNRALYGFARALSKNKLDEKKAYQLFKKISESEVEDFWKELARKVVAGQDAKEGKSE